MKRITVEIDENEWHNLLEGWGDGSLNWDSEDTTPVYKTVINPIQHALNEEGN